MKIDFVSSTDVGQVRSLNEDSVLATDVVGAVADGMGGHSGGEVASALALSAFLEGIQPLTGETVVAAAQAANSAVLAKARSDEGLSGMGTTLCAVGITNAEAGRVSLLNVGDSRIYVLSGTEFVQLTEDHSFVESLVRDGRITPEQAAVHPQRNVLTRALGIDDKIVVDHWEMTVRTGDRFLLCSDGLFNEVTDQSIVEVLRSTSDANEAAATLIRMANEGGGHDNVSVVIGDVTEAPDTSDDPVSVRLTRLTPAPTSARIDPPESSDESVIATEDQKSKARKPPKINKGFSWRTPMFVGAILLTLALAAGAVYWNARLTYFVGTDDSGQIYIYRGQPGGVLWLDPIEEKNTRLVIDQIIDESKRREIEENRTFGSLSEANTFLTNLPKLDLDDVDSTTTTSSTTTTEPVTTTTEKPAAGNGGNG